MARHRDMTGETGGLLGGSELPTAAARDREQTARDDAAASAGSDGTADTVDVQAHAGNGAERLVSMQKDGITLKIHPTCVADHARLGWKVTE